MVTRIEDDPLTMARKARDQANAVAAQLDGLKSGRLSDVEADLRKLLEETIPAHTATIKSLNAAYTSLSNRLSLQHEQAQKDAGGKGEDEDERERDWLTVVEPLDAFRWLCELDEWHTAVYVRMAGKALPECWPWHSRAVEVLLALMAQRAAAYASPTGVSDFRGRWLPNAVKELWGQNSQPGVLSGCSDGDHVDGRNHYQADPTKLRELAEWHVTRQEGTPPGLTPIT